MDVGSLLRLFNAVYTSSIQYFHKQMIVLDKLNLFRTNQTPTTNISTNDNNFEYS